MKTIPRSPSPCLAALVAAVLCGCGGGSPSGAAGVGGGQAGAGGPAGPARPDAGSSGRGGAAGAAGTAGPAGAGGSTGGAGAAGGAGGAGSPDPGGAGSPRPGGPDPERAQNPFAGARFYLDPTYVQKVESSRSAAPPELAAAVEQVKAIPTAIWLDRIAALDGLEAHLDEAVRQQAAQPAVPLVVVLVVYDLPNRDCAAFASNGELQVEADGVRRYREEYIDVLARKLQASPQYRRLRVVAIVEPDSLPNLVTNLGTHERCRSSEAAYREGVRYAVSRLSELDHVYLYLDIAHSGWLGWEHTDRAAQVYRDVLGDLLGRVQGFATNVANYSALEESFDPYQDVNRYMDVITGFYEWNRMIDELTFVERLRQSFPDKGFVIDTSRSGWRPQPAATPIERRTHRGNWCNIAGAGLGERPRATPRPGIDAYLWIKPPGDSDGTSDASQTTPNEEGKRFDPMCGQDPVVRPSSMGRSIPTDALPGAPHAGHWFHEQFLMLVENATPPL